MNMHGEGYIGVDLDACVVLFKAEDMYSACLLSALEHEDKTHLIFPVERRISDAAIHKRYGSRVFPKFLAGFEQERLWKNMTGEERPKTWGELSDRIHAFLLEMPYDVRSRFDLERRAGSEPLAVDLREITPIQHVFHGSPTPPPSRPAPIPSAPSAPKGEAMPSLPAFAIPAAPKAPGAIPSAPKPGGTTARVWEIATAAYAKKADGGIVLDIDIKALRTEVINACTDEGINPGTAATQFGAWKKSKQL